MSYQKYQGRKWKVVTSNSPECPLKSKVTFHGLEDQVTVKCGDNKPYGLGAYNSSSKKIEANEYEISMTGGSGSSTITFTRKSGHLSPRTTGSWTAEDNGPWSGED